MSDDWPPDGPAEDADPLEEDDADESDESGSRLSRLSLPSWPGLSDRRREQVDRVGTVVGRALAKTVTVPLAFTKSVGKGLVGGITRKIPKLGASMWRDLLKWSAREYQKATGADAVAFSAEPGGIEPRAVRYTEPDEDDPEQKPGWEEIGGDKTWGPGAEGKTTERMGKADVILADRAAPERAGPLRMRYAEALDLEQVDGLIVEPQIQQTTVQQWPKNPGEMEMGANGAGEAVADGGLVDQRQLPPEVVDPSELGWDDAAVDLESDYGDGRGMRVSARKYKDEKLSTSDAEEHAKAETRGFLAGKSGEDNDKVFKIAIIALAAIVLLKLGPIMLNILFGSGGGSGGGGGSMLPIMVSLVG